MDVEGRKVYAGGQGAPVPSARYHPFVPHLLPPNQCQQRTLTKCIQVLHSATLVAMLMASCLLSLSLVVYPTELPS